MNFSAQSDPISRAKVFDRRKYLVTSILAFLEPKLEISFSISGEITTEYL